MVFFAQLIKDSVQDNHNIRIVFDNGKEIIVNRFDDYKNNVVYVSKVIKDSIGTRSVSYYINVDKISYLIDR